MVNVVWLKRDIRGHDHAALAAAEAAVLPYVIVYLFEPTLISLPDTSVRHLQFQYHSVLDLQNKRDLPVMVCYAEAVEVFEFLHQTLQIQSVFSYQESGVQATWDRDKAVGAYFEAEQVTWQEFQRDGIQRGIKNRKNWDKAWFLQAHSMPFDNTFNHVYKHKIEHGFTLPLTFLDQMNAYPAAFQPAGESYAFKYLYSFLRERAATYSKHLSKPEFSRRSCSRLSAYLAWGNISHRVAYLTMYGSIKDPKLGFGLKNAIMRLRWHCHFIQKFEMECSYAHTHLNPAYDTFPWRNDASQLEAWKTGHTGFPLVDACMRCLHATGWVNFRMRSMLVSFLTHHLLIDWRLGVHHLAKLFLDYEPGIHYTQFQMQASTTGINTIRIYNPIKQSEEQDVAGTFIRKYVPELAAVPLEYLHQPWLMPAEVQEEVGVHIGKEYPAPVIDFDENLKIVKPLLWGMHKSPEVKKYNQQIVAKHARPSV